VSFAYVRKHAPHADGVVVSERAADFEVWRGERPLFGIVAVGGQSFALSPWERPEQHAAVVVKWSADFWNLAGEVAVFVMAATNVYQRTLADWAVAAARASMLVVEEPVPPNARHVLKLCAVAAIPRIVLAAPDDDGEAKLRALVTSWSVAAGARLNGDDALAARTKPSFDEKNRERLAAALAPIVASTTPKSLPDAPLVESIALANGQQQPPEKSALFTGRCVVDAGSWTLAGGSAANRIQLRSGIAVLPPPNGVVAFLDEANELVAVRKVKLAAASSSSSTSSGSKR
jgi:hypothetical protein